MVAFTLDSGGRPICFLSMRSTAQFARSKQFYFIFSMMPGLQQLMENQNIVWIFVMPRFPIKQSCTFSCCVLLSVPFPGLIYRMKQPTIFLLSSVSRKRLCCSPGMVNLICFLVREKTCMQHLLTRHRFQTCPAMVCPSQFFMTLT
jgi:hypothetical protein